jgi:hypothetical protein
MHRRAILLGPDLPLYSINYATHLVNTGQPVRARALAARFAMGGPVQVAAGEAISAMVDAAEARFGRAHERAKAAVMALETFGNIALADNFLRATAMTTAFLLGGEEAMRALADAFAERFVLAEPHRLTSGHFAPTFVAETCAWSSRAIAARCFERLRGLIAAGYFVEGRLVSTEPFVEAAERFSQGDIVAAARAYRPLLTAPYHRHFSVAIFDAAGEHEIASRLDAFGLASGPSLHGATLSHLREARRALAKKDWARAREMAQTVIDAWSVADVKVPAVDEMRALIARLPPP